MDDEKSLVKGLLYNLEQEGYEAVGVYDGYAALQEARTGKYDLVLLDIMLPGVDGFTICKIIHGELNIPVIMLTARGDEMDRITGLEIGADDYLAKPFNIRELLARINSVLRRAGVNKPKVMTYFNFRMDLEQRILKIDGQEIDLTSKEFDLLAVFLKRPGQVFSRQQLLDLVWEGEYADERTVDVNVKRLRSKIEPNPDKNIYLHTKWGTGYFFSKIE
ncbi:MAG: response regulator transcription factor [Syntrophomonadaceae bacterium]